MVEVKLLVSRVGTGFAQSAGQIVRVGEGEALRMVKAGQAKWVDTPAPEAPEPSGGVIETAMRATPAPDTETRKRASRRRARKAGG